MHFTRFIIAAMVTAIDPVIGAPSDPLQQRQAGAGSINDGQNKISILSVAVATSVTTISICYS